MTTDQWPEVAVGQGDTVVVGGRDRNWSNLGAESPAKAARLSGATGEILASVTLDANKLGVGVAPTPTSSGDPTFDSIIQVAVSPSRVFMVWDRVLDGYSRDVNLVALDSCSLSVVAVQPLPGVTSPQDSHALAYDALSDTVWVPGFSTAQQITGFNGTSLARTATASVSGTDFSSCVADWNGAIWYSTHDKRVGVLRIDPVTGAVSSGPPYPQNCVQTDGTKLYLTDGDRILALENVGEAGRIYPLKYGHVAGLANGQTWVVGDAGGSDQTIMELPAGTSARLPQLLVLSTATTLMNVWLIDFGGQLYVM